MNARLEEWIGMPTGRPEIPGQIAIFEPVEPPVPTPKPVTIPGKPKWTRYRPVKRVPCDDCMRVLAETKGTGPASRGAIYKRVSTGVELLLCSGHAAVWRDKDGLPKLQAPEALPPTTTRRRRA